eukprot:TRINITY_DN35686_c0_g1_i1.p1 TRINITY_DN35686_c0_g1~~TRINITY_DN35686_c0_g1_i1.p1  ORF type:complete len:434 (+),score=103.09 TRINITY_DN35686_c0_g1_i1:135-1436(+)
MAALTRAGGLIVAAESECNALLKSSSSLNRAFVSGVSVGGRRDLSGAQIQARGCRSEARVSCAIMYARPSTAKLDLLEEAEKMWLRAHDDPYAGVPFTDEEFMEALSKFEYDFRKGHQVTGTIAEVDSSGAYVDIKAKSLAFLPLAEACIYKLKHAEAAGLYEGAEATCVIINEEDLEGRIVLSVRKTQYKYAWERARQLQNDDATVFGKVLSTNKGGLLAAVDGLWAFVPMSMVAVRTPKEELIGQNIALKLLEVDEERSRLVCSNRRAMVSNQASGFAIGSVVTGVVQSVKPYGAFIDLGGVNGLLHISQISHDRITHVESVLNEGDQIKVLVLSHDKEKSRLSLSTKKLEPTPGDMIRNPQLVFEKAEEMASTFRERVALAEAAAQAEQLRMEQNPVYGGQGGYPGILGSWPTFGADSKGEGGGLDLNSL